MIFVVFFDHLPYGRRCSESSLGDGLGVFGGVTGRAVCCAGWGCPPFLLNTPGRLFGLFG